MKLHWADGNGGRRAANFVHYLGSESAFIGGASVGALALFDGKFYLFNGAEWLPLCTCEQGGDSGTEPTNPEPEPTNPEPEPTNPEPESEIIEPQILTRTIPCTLTINYNADGPETTWSWHYLGDGLTNLELPEYITSPDQIKVTGVNGEPIEVVDNWTDDDDVYTRFVFATFSGDTHYYLMLCDGPEEPLSTYLNRNTWQNNGWNVSMTVNITFDLTVQTVIAGYNPEGGYYCICPDVYNEGAYYMSTEGLEDTASGVVVNVQGANYSGTYDFDAKPDLVWLEYYDPAGDYGLRDLNIDWSKLSGATEIHIDTAGLVEIIRTQNYSDAENHDGLLSVHLPFTDSVTEDKCNNDWTETSDHGHHYLHDPKIEDGKLVLYDGHGLKLSGVIVLGGNDFTIDGIYLGCQVTTAEQRIFSLQTAGDAQNDTYSIALILNYGIQGLHAVIAGKSLYAPSENRAQWHHFALVYQHAQSKATLYIDGLQAATVSATLDETRFTSFIIGNSPSTASLGDIIGRFSQFRVFNGIAVWTDNFYFDVNTINNPLGGSWRYVNAGAADGLLTSGTTLTDLPETKSVTRTAFYQTAREKCFDLPSTAEIWIKFDVYFNGSNRWRAYNGGANGTTGITAQTSGQLSFFANDTNRGDFAGICKSNTLQTVLLHMISGSSAGVIEAWVDGTKIYRYTGDVNHGSDFADLYLQSDGAGTFFSNVIISNAEP